MVSETVGSENAARSAATFTHDSGEGMSNVQAFQSISRGVDRFHDPSHPSNSRWIDSRQSMRGQDGQGNPRLTTSRSYPPTNPISSVSLEKQLPWDRIDLHESEALKSRSAGKRAALHTFLRNLGTRLSKTADHLERRPISTRLWEGLGLKALTKFLRKTGRGLKAGGQKAGGLIASGAVKTGNGIKFTYHLGAGLAVGGVLAVFKGVGSLVRWTGRLAIATGRGTGLVAKKFKDLIITAAVGTKSGATKVAQTIKHVAVKAAKTTKTAAVKAAGTTKSATTKAAGAVVKTTFVVGGLGNKGIRLVGTGVSRGGQMAARRVFIGANKIRFRFGNQVYRMGTKLSKTGRKAVANSLVASESKGGKLLKPPSWIPKSETERERFEQALLTAQAKQRGRVLRPSSQDSDLAGSVRGHSGSKSRSASAIGKEEIQPESPSPSFRSTRQDIPSDDEHFQSAQSSASEKSFRSVQPPQQGPPGQHITLRDHLNQPHKRRSLYLTVPVVPVSQSILMLDHLTESKNKKQK